MQGFNQIAHLLILSLETAKSLEFITKSLVLIDLSSTSIGVSGSNNVFDRARQGQTLRYQARNIRAFSDFTIRVARS